MDFGKVTEHLLGQIDFTLPPDPAVNKEVLATGKGNTEFFVGCAKWGRRDWIGTLYPQGTKEKDFLKYYAEVFNSIEFNGFYYNLHSKEQVRKWRDEVPADFLFCPKFTQYITHIKRLKDTRPQVDEFFDVVLEFGKKLGPVFLLPHPQLNPYDLATLAQFIDELPTDISMFLELRHGDWFKGQEGFNMELFRFLKNQKRGLVITDAAGRRDCVHMHLSTPQCFIRFVGNALHRTDYHRIDDWVNRIKLWMAEGLEKCYFFMHQHEELHSPQLVKYLIEQLNEKCGTTIKPPVMQATLFG